MNTTETKQSTNQQATNELATKLKNLGYVVYLAESGTYGFFHKPNETKHISFQIDYFFFNFSSNYKGENIGTGHRLTNDEKCNIWEVEKFATSEFFESLINCRPYSSRRKKEKFLRWSTVQEHLDFYGSSSKYSIF